MESDPAYPVGRNHTAALTAAIRINAAHTPAADRPAPLRLAPLDVLRAVAVILVIVRHIEEHPSALDVLHRGGWIGVDLFFVLSGFLVSGLLFREWQTTGAVDIRRFLVRRYLKIYPAFYAFLLFGLFVRFRWQMPVEPRRWLAELFLVQNYLGGVFNHTWSLAVEEHFYLGIAGVTWLLVRSGRLSFVPWLMIAVGIVCLPLRLLTEGEWFVVSSRTHLRIDALGCGVLLAYLWTFHQEATAAAFRQWRWPALCGGMALLAPVFIWPIETTRALVTFGLTPFYLGSGLILMSLVANPFPKWLAPLGRIGAYSYSIYLWHMAVIQVLIPRLGVPDLWVRTLLTVGASIAVGIVAALLVEMPVLWLRDRFMPASANKTATGNRLGGPANLPPGHAALQTDAARRREKLAR